MKLIPDTAKVSALNIFCPHLSFRKDIYQFPDIHDAQYIMLTKTENAYPTRGEDLNKKIGELLNSSEWETLSSAKNIYLFKKR